MEHWETREIMAKMRQTDPIKTEREGSKDDRWVRRETKMRDEASAREEDWEIYTAGGRRGERWVCPWLVPLLFSCFISAVLSCAAESRQTDRQRPYDMAHIPGTFSMVYKPCAHTHTYTQPSSFMYRASANGTAVIMTARCNRLAVPRSQIKMHGQSRAWNKSQRRWHFFCCLILENGGKPW